MSDSEATRREVMAGLGAAGGALAAGVAPAQARQANLAELHGRDWAWLAGDWDVRHRRLRGRLRNSTTWEEFGGRSVVWLTMNGLGTIDDNILDLPDGVYRATGIRALDPRTREWLIWWLDGRNPTRIDPPVRGRFAGDEGVFLGDDTLEGRPIRVRFHWDAIHGPLPHWRQSFSPDGGATWEMNWENWFTRRTAAPAPLPVAHPHPGRGDFDFLAGRWDVRHRRLKRRLAGETEWETFGGTFVNWPVLGGQGNVGDNVFDFPDGVRRGMGVRAFDPASGQWSSWWFDGRDPTRLDPPVRGGFADGVGTFVSDDVYEGRPIKVRVLWSRTANTPRWEQAFSADGGATWETNWISDFTRTANT